MDVSIMIEGQMGLTWERWKRIVVEVDQLGFAGLYRSDHFVSPAPPDSDSLEMITSLTWLADHTQRIRFGPLVSPVSFRDPVMLARQAAALDELSGGRMDLGLGAGWMDREHRMFGYDLGDVPTRMARLEEGLEVATRLLRAPSATSFDGRFYQLESAIIAPRPTPGPRIVVGGSGPRRTLPLAARYADVWNGFGLSPTIFAQRCAVLDEQLDAAGRARAEVQRTLMTSVHLDVDDEGLRSRGALAGSLMDIQAQLGELASVGCDGVMLQWFALDDLDGIRRLASLL
jgi:F420-dependent oxidoreductase-like protein